MITPYVFLLQPTLWSKVFKYQLELGHNEEAYAAMIENPDPSRRKDCLRQLLICLCERGDLQALVDFPYIDLEDEVGDRSGRMCMTMDLLETSLCCFFCSMGIMDCMLFCFLNRVLLMS